MKSSNKAPKQPRFRHLFGPYYFCLSRYAGMGFGMGEDYVSYDRVFPCVYQRRSYAETVAYFDGLRRRFGK